MIKLQSSMSKHIPVSETFQQKHIYVLKRIQGLVNFVVAPEQNGLCCRPQFIYTLIHLVYFVVTIYKTVKLCVFIKIEFYS